jgi:multiple sugar transport system substrate-binding protein
VEIASGTAPDVIYSVTDDLAKLALRNGVVNLLPYMKRDKVDFSPYFPQVVKAMRFNGGMYAFPFHFSTDVLFYNKNIFDQAGIPYPDETWDYNKWIEVSKKLTKKDAKGFTTVFGTTPPDPVTWMMSYGAKQFSDDYTHCTIYSPEAIEALQDRMAMVYKYGVSPDANQLSGVGSQMMFTTGKLAMMPGRTYMVIDFNKQITNFRYDVAPIPKGKKGRLVKLAVGGLAITQQSKHKEEAWKFVQYYTSAMGGLQVLGHEKNCVPAVKCLAYSKDFFLMPPPENAKIFVDSIKDAKITQPPILQSAEYTTRILVPTIDNIWIKKQTIQDGLKDIQNQTNALLKEH